MKKYLTLLIMVVLVLGLAACGSSASNSNNATPDSSSSNNEPATSEDPIKLTYAFFAPANTFPAVQMEKWKEELEKRTNGKVQVDLFHGGTLLDAANMYDGVKNKVADIGLSSTSYEPGRFPLLGISDMPSNYPNAKVASLVVHDLIEKYPPEAFNDFKIITSFATEPAFVQSQVPVTTIDELKGKQFRISGALTPIMEEMGAAPVGISQAETAEALQTGIIEGYVSSREILKDLKLAENIKYVTDYTLTINTFVAVMNKDTWNSLPEDVQQVIDELNLEMTQFTGEYLDNHVQDAVKWSEDEHGLQTVQLTDAPVWDEKLAKIKADYVKQLVEQGLPAEEYKKTLDELVEKYSNQ
ncbi:TRAP transporter substrate-binding protein [Bacillus sp. Marseille-P3661]|uniref:TRAP transporter substrate-binding protein n=1 Tax=Bacillus sp. Marseille-P3661 TaxID=1936234 RepID=UPI000C821A43|nr:TRAP transporter substrate-binding protein [Bacillus sp. Marseille-P3661]